MPTKKEANNKILTQQLKQPKYNWNNQKTPNNWKQRPPTIETTKKLPPPKNLSSIWIVDKHFVTNPPNLVIITNVLKKKKLWSNSNTCPIRSQCYHFHAIPKGRWEISNILGRSRNFRWTGPSCCCFSRRRLLLLFGLFI